MLYLFPSHALVYLQPQRVVQSLYFAQVVAVSLLQFLQLLGGAEKQTVKSFDFAAQFVEFGLVFRQCFHLYSLSSVRLELSGESVYLGVAVFNGSSVGKQLKFRLRPVATVLRF